MFKKITKILFTCLFLALAIFLVLFSLDKLNVISLDFSFLQNIPGWDNVMELESKHHTSFNCLVFGISLLFSYIALNIILSMIPVLGKVVKIIIKIIIGWLLILASVALIVFGIVGLAGLIPAL